MDLPELNGLTRSVVRIPEQQNVVVSDRVFRLIETSEFQRLRSLSQLGLVAKVYPGAVHTRFEHSLGVYQLAREVIAHLLASDSRFAAESTAAEISLALVSALLHDVGHWPYCHAIEDMGLDWVTRHEEFLAAHLDSPELACLLKEDWNVDGSQVVDFLRSRPKSQTSLAGTVLRNVLNGPVDVDKMDYLARDSLHAGVPYGRNFDSARLINSLCIDWSAGRLCIDSKGKTAAEMLVFARYVMFSEVYWHHAVRSATAMLQRLVFETSKSTADQLALLASWRTATDSDFHSDILARSAGDAMLSDLASGVIGTERRLYKRVAQLSWADASEVHKRLRSMDYAQLVKESEGLAEKLARAPGMTSAKVQPTDVLIDAPPQKLEVQFKVAIRRKAPDGFTPLSDLSPVVHSLATEQFDHFVKQVRVFVNPELLKHTTKESLNAIVSDHLRSLG